MRRRYDLYDGVHKALRHCMQDTLSKVGALDSSDGPQLAAVLEQVRDLLSFCRGHLLMENRYIHTAMEARRPGSASPAAHDHAQHETACDQIDYLADLVALEEGAERRDAIAELYGALSLFVADNLAHMHAEETEHNAVLWAAYTDTELISIHQAIVGSLTPDQKAISLRWMLPALSPQERYELVRGMRMGMPANAFAGVLMLAERVLDGVAWRKLCMALSGPERMVA